MRKEAFVMQEIVKIEEFDGFKMWKWKEYCLKIDNLRTELIPGYDRKNVSKEDRLRDLDNFNKYFAFHYENKRAV
jgi:hypothetical protein